MSHLTTIAGVTAHRQPVCEHDSSTGLNGTHWECDNCGDIRPKTPAEIEFCTSLFTPGEDQ